MCGKATLPGYSLIEVLVSLTILSIVTLGVYTTLQFQSRASASFTRSDTVKDWVVVLDSLRVHPTEGLSVARRHGLMFDIRTDKRPGGYSIQVKQTEPASFWFRPGLPAIRLWVPEPAVAHPSLTGNPTP
ncbi:MAG: prepilin-type N-terminal cleavage/methylation domain-containing protein [Bacteroidetes bacterium]|nr:prepilin-type N-terminal cleavage/methylation domain-containing protein [Bacteroidota bacterium]